MGNACSPGLLPFVRQLIVGGSSVTGGPGGHGNHVAVGVGEALELPLLVGRHAGAVVEETNHVAGGVDEAELRVGGVVYQRLLGIVLRHVAAAVQVEVADVR